MKLYEYEAKAILALHGIPIPKGEIAANAQQARNIASKLGKPVAIKAQILTTGRGKAGGILFASNPQETEKAATCLLGKNIQETLVKSVLVEERIPIKKELYFGMTIDRLNRSYISIASDSGGIEIEEVAEQQPQKIHIHVINPQLGFRRFHARQIAQKLGYNGKQLQQLTEILLKTFEICGKYDLELFEINPLAETKKGKFIATDSKLIIDDNALFRQAAFSRKRQEKQRELSDQEFEALKNGLEYVQLNGNIGVVGNGAGLVMATLDIINLFGGKPANFLDIGGGAPPNKILSAFKIIFSNPNVKVLLVNILGGITLCDEIAKGIVEARKELGTDKPTVVRIVGTNEEEGKQILKEAKLPFFDSMEEAAKRAVELSKEKA